MPVADAFITLGGPRCFAGSSAQSGRSACRDLYPSGRRHVGIPATAAAAELCLNAAAAADGCVHAPAAAATTTADAHADANERNDAASLFVFVPFYDVRQQHREQQWLLRNAGKFVLGNAELAVLKTIS